MPVNCRTCRHYHRLIETYNKDENNLDDRGCLCCADYPRRKSNYSPINGINALKLRGEKQIEIPGT